MRYPKFAKNKEDAIAKGYTESIPNKSSDGYIRMIKIWEYINDILFEFKPCFSKVTAFKWFIIVIVGFMLRSDYLGVTSIIRVLNMNSDLLYLCLLHFFHSNAWKLDGIMEKWIELVKSSNWIYREYGKPVLIGDGVIESKEGKKMPAVKKLRQMSENSAKPEFTWGHMFGCIGILIGNANKLFNLPLSLRIHDGNQTIREWTESEYIKDSHVTRLVREAFKVATLLKETCFLVLDRYYLSVNALIALKEEAWAVGIKLITVITRVKKDCVAFEKPIPDDPDKRTVRPKRGRKAKQPPKKGNRVELFKLFTTAASQFTKSKIMMYGELKEVSYLCVDLLWGDGLFQELRFVLTLVDGRESALVSTSLLLTPEKIIALYCCRAKIEVFFNAFKNAIKGFGYHFWSRLTPILKRRDPAKAADEKLKALGLSLTKAKTSIINTYKATEGFVMFCCIATGILQLIALTFTNYINAAPVRWLRTRTNIVPSEESTAVVLRDEFWRIYDLCPYLGIIRIIRQKLHPKLPDSETAA